MGAAQSSSGESSPEYGVRKSTVVEKGQLDYVLVVAPSRKVAGPADNIHLQEKSRNKCPGV